MAAFADAFRRWRRDRWVHRQLIVALSLLVLLGALWAWIAAGPAHRPLAAGSSSGAPAPPQIRDRLDALLDVSTRDWEAYFHALGGSRYPPPTLKRYHGSLHGGDCGFAVPISGTFYCPSDQALYVDLDQLQRLGLWPAGGSDAALHYLLGHEVGHHVQLLLGATEAVLKAMRQSDPALRAHTLLAFELQADCYAGLLAAHDPGGPFAATGSAETAGSIEALASPLQAWHGAVNGAWVVPDALTHGTSEQRLRWYRRGLQSTGLPACDTFASGSAL